MNQTWSSGKKNTYLVTGGSGSLGKALAFRLLQDPTTHRIRIFSRDEFKQYQMQQQFKDERLRFFIGDVRDLPRLESAMKGVKYLIHAAAMKQVPACEYNPFEAVKTNILGTQNVISAASDAGVESAILVSTDKAVDPINLYGATKMVAEKLWIAANQLSDTSFNCARYGNVWGSRGSVMELFKKQAKTGKVTITDPRMTRFILTLDQAVTFVLEKLKSTARGQIYIPDLPSMKITDIARTIAPKARQVIIGIRQGEKLHEKLSPTMASNQKRRLVAKL
jgi:UDP-N-acetylglucosamine 4,6-dehydratase/5-epimerase